jgi:hypothetical protein
MNTSFLCQKIVVGEEENYISIRNSKINNSILGDDKFNLRVASGLIIQGLSPELFVRGWSDEIEWGTIIFTFHTYYHAASYR